jgi:3-methyladenine DNA glycosylase/8-oxoguanine DNA glycosylase
MIDTSPVRANIESRRAAAGAISIPVQQPFPWQILLRSLTMRLIPGRERIDKDRYIRLGPNGNPQVSIRYDSNAGALHLDLAMSADPAGSARSAARLFRPTHDSQAVNSLRTDPLLGPRIAAVPGLRPLGGWEPFELCVRTLIGQQVSVKAAQGLIARVVERCGALEPERLAAANLDRIGMPGRRVAAIQGFAAAVRDARVDLGANWRELDRELEALPGFGPWTRSYLGIRLGRDPDAFPASDAGLLRAAGAPSPKALEKIAEAWRPHRALAATYLWMVPAAALELPQ